MPFYFKRLEIPDIIMIAPKVFSDRRGFFMETYEKEDFKEFGVKSDFLQDNHSKSTARGVLRGLHYQKNPMAQGKIIRVISGEIFDVALDIREGSPYYGKWVGTILSSENKSMLYVPEGFAHGFCTLLDVTEVIYKCTNIYSPDHERGILWNDPDIGIKWPIDDPLLSEKDIKNPPLKDADNNFIYGVDL